MTTATSAAALAVAIGAAGCDIYEPPADNLFGIDESGIGADTCPYPDANIVTRDSAVEPVLVRLNELADDIQACGKLSGFDGPDGVVGVELGANEMVHVSAELVSRPGASAPPVDVGVYMMRDCDPATCLKRVERCPAGHGERFAWSSEQQGTYYFGFDTRAYDRAQYEPQLEVAVIFPQCGDRIIDPGESCDDGNRQAGDGCSDNCQAELAKVEQRVPVEVEPNNYYQAGNVLVTTVGEPLQVKGYIGGGCDLDFYAIDIPEGGFASARLLGEDGHECGAEVPALALEFDDPSGNAELGKAKVPADSGGTNHCPQWDTGSFATSALPAGRYVIEMKPPDKGVGMEPFPYVLEVEVLPPPQST